MDETKLIDNRYSRVGRLGKGKNSQVWLVWDAVYKCRRALKYLSCKEPDSSLSLSQFKNEFRLLASLHHRNIPEVYDFGYDPNQEAYYYTSEYIEGEDIYNATLEKGQRDKEELLRQILTALGYIHQQGIIHYDIKCENILVVESNGSQEIKIVDFGLAYQSPKTRRGTLAYMAPELIIADGLLDHRLDLYSLGVVLFRVFLNRWPFSELGPEKIINWHLRGEISFSPWEEEKNFIYIRNLIVKLLAKKPWERFSSAQIAGNYLDLHSQKRHRRGPLIQAFPRRGPLVGREGIVKEICGQLEALRQKNTIQYPFNLIVGEQGWGRSRLLDETRYKAQLMEIPTCHIVPGLTADHLATLTSFFNISEKVTERDGFLKLAVDKILAASKETPQLLLIDDIHQLSKTTEDILLCLLKRLSLGNSNSSLLIIASGPRDYRLPLSPYITKNYQHLFKMFHLSLLNTGHIRQYLEEAAGFGDSKLAGRLFSLTSGNPLLLTEYLNAYGTDLVDGEVPASPKNLTDLYSHKIRSLLSREKGVLNIVALYNRPVTIDEIEQVSMVAGSDLLHILGKLQHLTLLQANAKNKNYAVANLILQQAITKGAGKKECTLLHEKIACYLERKDKGLASEISYHYARSTNSKKAVHYLIKAAECCVDRWDIELAINLYQEVDKFSTDAVIENKVARRLGRLKVIMGRVDEGIRLLKEALKSTSPHERIEDLRYIGNCYLKKGDYDNSSESYQQALQLRPKPKRTRINIINDLACLELQRGNYQKSIPLFQKAQKLATNFKDRYASHNRLGLALSQLGRFKEAKTFYANKLKALTEGTSNVYAYISCCLDYAFVLNTHGYFKASEQLLKKSLSLSLKNHYLVELPTVLNNLINIVMNQARYQEALSYLNMLREYQATIGTISDLAYSYLTSGTSYTVMGQNQLARIDLNRAKGLFEQIKANEWVDWVLLAEGYVLRSELKLSKSNITFNKLAKNAGKKIAHLASCALIDNRLIEKKPRAAEELYHRTISSWPPPEEPQLKRRLELLKLKLSVAAGEGGSELLLALADLCKQLTLGQWKELEWEAFLTLGQYFMNQDKFSQAAYFIKTSIKVLEEIMRNLPEEFRDQYKNDPCRLEVYKCLQQIQKHPQSEKQEIHQSEKRSLAIENLLDIDKKIHSELNLEVLLRDILDFALQLSGAERGYLLLGDKKENIKIRTARNVKKEDEPMQDFSRSVALKVISSGKTFATLDVSGDSEFSGMESVRNFELKSIVCIPLMAQNQITGVIYLDNRQKIIQLTEKDLGLLQEFGTHAAIALENARIMEQIKVRQEELTKKLDQAKKTILSNDMKFKEATMELNELKTKWNTKYLYKNIVGQSLVMQETLKLLDKITPYSTPVFIYGETGTGKELLAKALHTNSPRAQKQFVAINCANLPMDILESELFGYQKGAFTGAFNNKKGLFEIADGGTLFLDEISNMSLETQAKILRVIQEQGFYRLGGTLPISVNTRVVSASNEDLKKHVREGKFRQDLYYRLCGLEIKIPPLRERKTDIPILVQHFIKKCREENKIIAKIKVSSDVMKILLDYHWPGNIRQLEHCINNAIIVSSNHIITTRDVFPLLDIKSHEGQHEFHSHISVEPEKPFSQYEMEIIKKSLNYFNGNRVQTAKHLKISRTALINKIRRLGIERSSFAPPTQLLTVTYP